MKRRRVFRALVGWGIFSFAVLQVFEPIMHGLHLPEWTLSAAVLVLAAGFPATLVLAWIFDLGPSGIERTPPAGDAPGGTPRFGRKRLLAALVLIGVVLAAPGLAWWFLLRERAPAGKGATAAFPAGAAAPPSIAVLPLVNISGDPGQDYFGDGITEEITSKLSRLRSLAVTARTSAAKYKGSTKSAREIGGELGVGYLVEGSVRRAGDRVKVNASLVRTSDAVQVWSEDQDARIDDIFDVQDRIAGRIVEALGLKLTPVEASALADWGTRNARAYDEFLKGTTRYAQGADDPRILRESIALFERALAIDPGFAPAIASLATALSMQYRDVDGSPATLKRAESLAARAMELAPQLPESLKAAGDVRAVKFDYAGAGRLYRQGVEATPRDHVAWDELCWMLGYAGPPYLEEGEAACRRALELAPWYWAAHYHLLRVHVQQGRLAEAEADLRALEAATDAGMVHSGRYWLAMATGRWKDAIRATAEGRDTNLIAAWRAMALAQAGEKDRAFRELDRALAKGFKDGNDLRKARWWEPLRSDPRWAATLRRHGIAP